MIRRWPLRQNLTPTVDLTPTVEAPERMLDYDQIEIRVTLTPTRCRKPVDSVHSVAFVHVLEAKDARALEYITRQMVDALMREWARCQE